MSQHPSLRSSAKDKQHRSVLKRYERIGILKEKELWKNEESVFGLPKVKVVQFKIKKEKAAAVEATAEGLAPAEGTAPGKTAAPAKAAAAGKAATPAKESGKAAAEKKK